MKLNVVYAGIMEYPIALEFQKQLLTLCEQCKIDDTLLLLEHPSVLTFGIRAESSNVYLSDKQLEDLGIKIFKVNRGGDVTYHGPGQIVGYPIFNLNRHGKDIKNFVFKIQEVFIRLLADEYRIEAHRETMKYTGVYVNNDKITAIGIAIKHWTTMHGFAFNVNTDLSHFGWINPCGLSDRGVTSLQKITGFKQDIEKLCKSVSQYFCQVFGMEANECTLKSLIG